LESSTIDDDDVFVGPRRNVGMTTPPPVGRGASFHETTGCCCCSC
jgi:hypothetical protein